MRSVVLLIAIVVSACGGETPTSPGGAAESVSWTVNSQSFTASSNGRAALHVASALSVSGANCGSGAILSINVSGITPGAATYSVGSGGVTITWTPDARTGEAANEAWSAPGLPRVIGNTLVRGGSGAVTITNMSSDWVSGSFSAEVVANPSNRDPAPKTVQGTFELPIRDRRVC